MKKFLAVIAGLVVGFVIFAIIEFGVLQVFPFPDGTDYMELDSMKSAIRGMSVGALVSSMLAHAVGALGGGVVVGRILKSDTMNVGMTLGIVMTVLGMFIMVVIDPPEYFYFDCLMYIPGAMFGANYTSKL